MELTRGEREIMEVLWAAPEPMSRSDLIEHEEKSWKDSSVHILLNGLLRKGIIREAGYIRRTKTISRTFVPVMNKEAYFADLVFSYSSKPEPMALFEELLRRPEVTPEHRRQLRQLLEQPE